MTHHRHHHWGLKTGAPEDRTALWNAVSTEEKQASGRLVGDKRDMFSPQGETLSESEKTQTKAAPSFTGHRPTLWGNESCPWGQRGWLSAWSLLVPLGPCRRSEGNCNAEKEGAECSESSTECRDWAWGLLGLEGGRGSSSSRQQARPRTRLPAHPAVLVKFIPLYGLQAPSVR